MQIQPYLFFDGRCEEAVEFYRQALGAEVLMLMHFSEGPPPDASQGKPPPGDKVMHATLQIGSTQVMMSDGHCAGHPEFKGFSLSIAVGGDDEARRVFDALAKDGEVRQPLSQTFFASSFGMLADRFGVAWMVIAATEPKG